MTWEAIGGHRNRTGGLGVEVFRGAGEHAGLIRKESHTPADHDGLRNELFWLTTLEGAYAPVPTGYAPDRSWIEQQDLGMTDTVHDEELFRRQCTLMLWNLRAHGCRHGDLKHETGTGGNVIIRDDKPLVIDFQQSTNMDDPAPAEQALPDGYNLWRWVPFVMPDTARVVRRWHAIRGALGGNVEQAHNALVGRDLVDLGTHMGDFPAMAVADGMTAMGVDNNRIRDGLGFAVDFWPKEMGLRWSNVDIMDVEWSRTEKPLDVVLWLRTWPYHIETHGRPAAEAKLAEVIRNCNVLFFEPQLQGDGPGPAFLPDLDAVRSLCLRCGAKHAEPLVTLPTGRPKETTTWEVRR